MCDILKEIFKETNYDDFNYGRLDDRIALQKTVYLLMNMGVNVGDYSFEWGKYGPYSLALDVDAFKCSQSAFREGIAFSEVTSKKIEKIVEYIKEGQEKYSIYTRTNWLESIASLHYLKYVLHIKESEQVVLDALQERKEHLNSNDANCRSLEIADEIENM